MAEIIDSIIKRDIELKMKKLVERPEFYNERKKLVNDDLRSIGDIYSFWIENPDLRRALLQAQRKEESLRKEAIKGIQAVHNGWYYLSKIGEYGDFLSDFSPQILKKLNSLVEYKGSFGVPGEFRTKDVTLNVKGYTPPGWEKVPNAISNLLIRLKQGKDNPLETSILAHLGIAATQPFAEGNKRCARLIQDRILLDAGMPPSMIPAGEGTFYFNLLSKTLPSYRDGNEIGQKEFYDYCASKVNNGLDLIIDDLDIK